MPIKLTTPADQAVQDRLDEASVQAAMAPPPVLMLRRKTIRMHGPTTGVALYYADQLGKYVSIPFGADTMMAEEIDLGQLDEAQRWKIVKARFRNGKLQRRVKVPTVKGFTFREKGGSKMLVRMSTTERIHRRIGARRGKIKRRSKRSRARMKYLRTMRRRTGLGL
jgi:hypothetical protein